MFLGIVGVVFFVFQFLVFIWGFVYFIGMFVVLVVGVVIMGIGLIDDCWGLDVLMKFVGQIMVVSVLVIMGVVWSVLYILVGGVGIIVLDQVFLILFILVLIVLIVNVMNFVDGFDGLVVGLGLIMVLVICMFLVGLFCDYGGDVLYYLLVVILVVLVGVCLGFLLYNFYWVKIFMGDFGLMLIGLMLVVVFIIVVGLILQNVYGVCDVFVLLLLFLLVVVVMFVLMFDLLLVIVCCICVGCSVFSLDKMYLYYWLLQIGYFYWCVVLIIYLWVGIGVFGVVSLIFFNLCDIVVVMLGVIVVVGVVILIFLLCCGDDYYDLDLDQFGVENYDKEQQWCLFCGMVWLEF